MLPELPRSGQLYQFALAYHRGLLLAAQNHQASPSFRLTLVRLACPPPANTTVCQVELGCPIEFNARHIRLRFARARPERPQPGAHALTFWLVEDVSNATHHRVCAGDGIIGEIESMLPPPPKADGHNQADGQ